MLSIQNAAIAA